MRPDWSDPTWRAAWAEASALTPVLDLQEGYQARHPGRDALLGWLVLLALFVANALVIVLL